MSGGRVVVVGGGLAGIAAALRCADLGARVTLVEVRPRLGGAAYSFERDGLSLDNGQHVFLRCCTAYRELLRRLGSEQATILQPRLAIEVLAPGGRSGRLRRSALPAPLHLAGALARYPFLRTAERAGVVRAALALRRLDPDDPALDERSFGDWLADHGQGPAAIEALWNLIALPTLNLPADQASLALAARVFRTGLLDQRDAGDVGFARAPLGEVHDRPARRALEDA
ncbi:MAG: FAD-dependent oxidoreductase, partial [Thermoleophilaceae bacterium]